MFLIYRDPKAARSDGERVKHWDLNGRQSKNNVPMADEMEVQWVILIFTLRDFWDPDSRGGKNTNENQREREKEREKGDQWVTLNHAGLQDHCCNRSPG